MTTKQLLVVLVVLTLAPFVAIAAGALQRQTQGVLRGFAELIAVVALCVALNASILAMWGAHAAGYAHLHPMAQVFYVALQPILPFFCYFQIVRPARASHTPPPTPF